jgi:glycosyltransferase involved in cell wall biosynthesis
LETASLRIGFDGRAFTSPAAGVRRYVIELANALADVEPGLELVALGAAAGTRLPHGVVGISASSMVPTNLGWAIEGLPRAGRHAGLDVFHAPAYTTPLWGVHPLVVTLHDVSYARRPEWYPHRLDPVRRWFYRRSALSADVVITDSEFSRREIETAYGLRADCIRVIPLGVGAPFMPDPDAAADARELRPFILHVGDLHERRNVGTLIEALALLHARDDASNATELVLVGKDRGTRGPLMAQAEALGVAGAVRVVADADDREIVSLMRRASVFAYPSLYEGFGLPVLEAMACGAPVIASTAASVPEVVGDAGLLVDPHDVRGWYEALVAVLTSPSRTAALRHASLARAARFTWRGTARQTLDVYRRLARGRA